MSSLFDSPIFETALSVILICIILSLLVSSVAEIINGYFNERGKQLYNTISRLFDDKINVNFGQLLYSHPMVASLRKNEHTFPTYISDSMFSQIIIEVVSNYSREFKFDADKQAITIVSGNADITGKEPNTTNIAIDDLFSRFWAGVNKMEHTSLKLMLMNMAEKSIALAGNDAPPIANLEKQLKQWYNDQMDRMTGWYKDSIKKRLRIVAFVVAITLNVDAIHVFRALYENPPLRTELSALSEKVGNNYSNLQSDSTLTQAQKEIKAVEMSKIKTISRDTTQLSTGRNMLGQMQRLDSISGILLGKLGALDSVSKTEDSTRAISYKNAYDRIDEIESLALPIGWKEDVPPRSWFSKATSQDTLNAKYHLHTHDYFENHKKRTIVNVLLYILGIAITTFSISQGAPFWFDILLKFVNIRKAGKKPSTSE